MSIVNKVLGKIIIPAKPLARYVVELKRNYRVKKFHKQGYKILEICGGRYPVSDKNLNIDGLDAPEVDIVHYFPKPMPFEADSVDKIITIAALEHFNLNNIREILKDFFRVLKMNGKIEICVPALDKIFQVYQQSGCTDILLRYIFGGQKDTYDVHLCVLDTSRFIKEMIEIGFANVREEVYDYSLHDKEYMTKIVAEKTGKMS